MNISEDDYRSLLDAAHRGDLTIMIDTASFRQLFVRYDSTSFSERVGESLHTRISVIRFLTFLEVVLPFAAMALSFVALGWWGLLVAPVIFTAWTRHKMFASWGVQRIGPASLFFASGILIAAILPELNIWVRLLIIVLTGIVFMTRLLYVYTASVVFGLIHSNYLFFEIFFMRPEGVIVPLIWTDPDHLSVLETTSDNM